MLEMTSREIVISSVLCCVWVVVVQGASHCRPDQILRANTPSQVCCFPVFNCGPGKEVRPCTTDGGRDTCQPCASGYLQPELTSSLDGEEHQCFPKSEETDQCPLSDTTPTDVESPEASCTYYCRCKYEHCYYGYNPCTCNLGYECDPGATIDKLTGECRPCPPLHYKDEGGCGPCLVNETAWRLEQFSKANYSTPLPPTDHETDSSTRETTHSQHPVASTPETGTSNKTSGDSTPIGLIVGLVLAAAAICVVIFLVMYCRRRREPGDQNSRLYVFFTKLKTCSRHTTQPLETPLTNEASTPSSEERQPLNTAVPTAVPTAAIKPFSPVKLLPNGNGPEMAELKSYSGETTEQTSPEEGACGGPDDNAL